MYVCFLYYGKLNTIRIKYVVLLLVIYATIKVFKKLEAILKRSKRSV